MRRTAAATMTVAALAFTLTACNSDSSVKTEPKTNTTSAAPTTASATPSPTKTTAAGVGDTISVKGDDDGSKLDVTLVKLDPHAKAGDYSELDHPGTDRWVGVQFRVTNTGTAVYADSPGNGVQLADADGQQFTSTIVDVTDGPSMASSVRLTTGKSALGWIVFEVPKASKLDTVQFAMDSGFADQAAEWQLS